MELKNHYALATGPAPFPDGRLINLRVVALGDLQVASGRLGACDPFVNLDAPTVIPIPAGTYVVKATVADVSPEQDGSRLREAYLSLVLSELEAKTVEPAVSEQGPPEPGTSWGVAVDAGTVAFVDADSALRCMPNPDTDWYSNIFDNGETNSWFAQMDQNTPQPAGFANITLPLAEHGENLVLSHSGWGDGQYPLVVSRAEDGSLTGVHIDLLVIGTPDEDEQTPSESQNAPPTPPKQRFRWFRRS